MGPNPTDRGKVGTKHHLIMDNQGIPLAFVLTATNTHDSLVFDELIDAIKLGQASLGQAKKAA